MSDIKQSIRQINELIDLVLTLRICQANHRKSNSKLRKCAALVKKRCKEPFVRGICDKLAVSTDVVADVAAIQRNALTP